MPQTFAPTAPNPGDIFIADDGSVQKLHEMDPQTGNYRRENIFGSLETSQLEAALQTADLTEPQVQMIRTWYDLADNAEICFGRLQGAASKIYLEWVFGVDNNNELAKLHAVRDCFGMNSYEATIPFTDEVEHFVEIAVNDLTPDQVTKLERDFLQALTEKKIQNCVIQYI